MNIRVEKELKKQAIEIGLIIAGIIIGISLLVKMFLWILKAYIVR